MYNNRFHARTQKGFTLIEILIALMIFAVLGVLAAMSLHTIIHSHEQLKKSDKELLQLQITMTLMRRDIAQVIDRKIRNTDDIQELAFSAEGGSKITFTRTGLLNPFYLSRQSNMQRVGYTVEGNNLVRLTWNVLDQPPGDQPEKQVLLSGVQSIQWQFIADDGAQLSSWPPSTGTNMQQESESPLPKVVLLTMNVKKIGVVQGVFPVPARGIYAQKNQTPS